MSARRKVFEQLLVEASSNEPRKVSEGSVCLHEDGLIDWADKSRRGLEARTGLVHWPTFWQLVEAALSPVEGEVGAMTATVRRVSPRPRGEVSPAQQKRLDNAAKKRDTADQTYRDTVLAVMAEGASFPEVSKATGLSTNTLQRWKREAHDADND